MSYATELRAALATEESGQELPDGSSITIDRDEVPEPLQSDATKAEEEKPLVPDDPALALEAMSLLESEIDIDERLLEKLVANGEILTEVDLALESLRHAELPMDDTCYRYVRGIYDNLSVKYKLPALEDALGLAEHDREQLALATEAAVTDKVKDLIRRIIDGIINLFHRIKDWYLRVWDQAPRLSARAEKLGNIASNLNGIAKEPNFELNAVKTLGLEGKPIDPSQLVASMSEITTINKHLLTTTAGEYNKLANDLVTITKQMLDKVIADNKKRNDETLSTSRNSVEVPKVTIGENDKLVQNFISRFEKMIRDLNLNKEPAKDDPRFTTENTIYRTSSRLPGDMMLTAAYADKKAEISSELGRIKYSFGVGVVPVKPKPEPPENKGVFRTITLPDIDKLCSFAQDICTIVMEYKRLYLEREKVTDRLLKEINGSFKSSDDLDATGRRSINSSVSGATTIHKTMVSGEGRWVKYVMSVVSSTLDWCEESLRQYESSSKT